MTRERLEMDFGSFCQDVLIDVRDIQMATVARVCPMDRQGKLSLADLISMTAETFGVIQALRTVFLPLNGRLLSCFQGFGPFRLFGPGGALPLSGRVGCTDGLVVQNKGNREGDGDQNEMSSFRIHGSCNPGNWRNIYTILR
jgi:hypothetical protein